MGFFLILNKKNFLTPWVNLNNFFSSQLHVKNCYNLNIFPPAKCEEVLEDLRGLGGPALNGDVSATDLQWKVFLLLPLGFRTLNEGFL